MSSASVLPAVSDGAQRVLREAVALATATSASPLYGLPEAEIEPRDGALRARNDASRAVAYADVARWAPDGSLAATGSAAPGAEGERFSFHSFGAQFVEVRYDEELARLRVSRALGRLRLRAHPQREDRALADARRDHLGDRDGAARGDGARPARGRRRHQQPGRLSRPGQRRHRASSTCCSSRSPTSRSTRSAFAGVGEIGITGVAAAIANAVYHATGVRVRELPIVPERLLGAPHAA